MFLWIIITLIAHLLNAVVFIIDKHLVSKTVLKPVAYAFYSGIFQFAYLIMLFFGIRLPEANILFLSMATGALFTFTLLVFYKAMQASESTRVVPLIGGITPIFTFFLAYSLLGERLVWQQAIAPVFFIAGGFLLSLKFKGGRVLVIKSLGLAVLAAFLFAGYYTLMKFVFLRASFLSGFIAIQFGGFLGAAALLLFSKNRKIIFAPANATDSMKKETIYLFIPDKILGALASILIFYAVYLGSVTIINSLQAMQYVFLLILAIVFSKKIPDFLKEQIAGKIIVQKMSAIILIGIGLAILAWQ